jgi:O-antigen/teichoic acid export membrane protein
LGIIQKQGIQNTIITYLGIIIGFVSLIIVQPFLLSKEEVGLIRVLFAFSSLVASIIPLGITSITVKYFPLFRNRENGHYGFLGFILIFPIVGGLIIFFLLSIFKQSIIGHYVEHSKLFTDYFNYVLPFSIILGFITVLNTYCFSLFKTIIPSLLNDVFVRLLTIAIIYLYFLKLIDLQFLVSLYVGIYLLQLFLLLTYLFRIDSPKLRVDSTFLKGQNVPQMLSYGFLLSFAAIASLGLKYLDSIMIGKYMAIEFVGIYSIVAFIPTVIEAPLNSLDRIAYTKLSNAIATNNRKEIEDIYFKSSRYLFLIGGALYLAVNLNIADLLSFLPEGYSKGINVVFIISTGTLINMAGGSNTSLIFNSKYYKIGGSLIVLMAAMAFSLNVWLIPLFGLEGSALATAITIIVYAFLRYVIIYRGFNLQPYDKTMLKILILVLSGVVLNFLLPHTSSPVLNIFYRSLIIMSVYIGGTYFLKIVPEFHKFIPFRKK